MTKLALISVASDNSMAALFSWNTWQWKEAGGKASRLNIVWTLANWPLEVKVNEK